MIKVLPPPGWTPTPEIEKSFSSEDLAKVCSFASSSSFDEIDDILLAPKKLSSTKSSTAKTPRQPKLQPTSRHPKNQTRPAKNNAETAEPILPTGQWTPAQSHQRRKWLLTGVTILGAFVILASIVAAIFVNRQKEPIVMKNDNGNVAAPVEPAELPTETEPAAAEVESNDKPPAENPSPEVTPDPPAQTPGPVDPVESVTDNPPEIPGIKPKPDLPENPLASNISEPETVTPSNELIKRDLFGNSIEDESALGGLSALLNQSNTSIREIQDLAESVRDEETIGMARYFIAKPDPLEKKIGIEKRLGLSCGGVIYEDIPLLAMLRDVTAITGVPFALDVASFQAKDFDFDMTTNIKMEQGDDHPIDFAMVVETALAPLDVEQAIAASGFVFIQPRDAAKKSSTKYALPDFATKKDLAPKMVEFIKRLIAPDSWVAEDDPGSIVLQGDDMSVYQSPVIHRQIKDFLEKLTFVEQFQGKPEELANKAELRSRWSTVQAALEKPLELDRTFDVPLESLCSTIQQESGVTVLVDWPSIIPEGWTPATMVPGNINETSVYRTIKEIARSMKITMRAVDADTVELTTFRTATSQVELEVYYYGDILEKAPTEQQVIDIVTQTLSRELKSNPKVRMDYVPQLKCIIAVAPQTLQRQLEIVLDRLREL